MSIISAPAYELTLKYRPHNTGRLCLTALLLAFGFSLGPFIAPAFFSTYSGGARHDTHIEPARLSTKVTVRASGLGKRAISLNDGHDLLTSYVGPEDLTKALDQNLAEPLSLASADFDEDGVPDLVSGYSYNERGIITFHRGNVDSIYPNAPEAQERRADGTFTDAPFISPALVLNVPAPVDFLGAGDFDADGHWDLVVGSHSLNALFLLSGDGHGGHSLTKEVKLPGIITAMDTGEINRRDGLTDVVVGVATPDGPKVMVFESPKGALSSAPEVFDLSAQANSLGLGFLDEHYAADLAIAAGSELLVLSGRDRKLSLSEAVPVEVGPATIERHAFDSPIRSLAVGDFAGDSQSDIALLTEDGEVRVLGHHGQGDARKGTSESAGGRARLTLSAGRWPGASQLLVAGVSSLPKDDLLLADADGRRLHVVAGGVGEERSDGVKAAASSLDVEGVPLAMLPMRLDVDGLTDLVILRTGSPTPTVMLTAHGGQAGKDVGAPLAVTTFSNPAPITINDGLSPPTKASPYPSTIDVSGVAGTIDKLRVRLHGLTHTFADDIDVLLIGPGGQSFLLMSDAGGQDADNVRLTFDDSAVASLADGGPINSGSFKPTNFATGDVFPSPAPGGPYGSPAPAGGATLGSVFNGTNPNGTWSLYVVDDEGVDAGNISGGWTLYFGPDAPPTTFVVTNTNDSGSGSLRQAILDANANLSPDIISFNIGTGPQTITPTSPLPTISETVTIDATTQPGFAGQPIIELNMSQAGNNVSGFDIDAGSTVIRGFVINGLDPESSIAPGINIRRGTQNIVEGNYIGTNLNGTVATVGSGTTGGSETFGVQILDSNNTVGGTTAAARNLISGADIGVNIGDYDLPNVTNNRVQGNFICTNAAGTASIVTPVRHAFFPDSFGIHITDSPNNTIGGTTAGARNLISGCGFLGIQIVGFEPVGSTGNLIQGNFIGTDVSGFNSVPNNGGVGIQSGASSNTVGGSTVAARNLLSGNELRGGVSIGIEGFLDSTPDNIVQGNYIGTDVNGVGALANAVGVIIPANVVGSQINANRIAFNQFIGVWLRELGGTDEPGIRIAIFENEIYANGFLGIDLGPLGITANDAGDPDAGANLRQNFPVLTSATASASRETVWERAGEVGREMPDPILAAALTINGTLNSTPNTNFTVHWYFSADAQCTANQAASRPLAFGKVPNVTTDGSGNAMFTIPFDFPPGTNGGIVNCTATDPQGNTSEFSVCFSVGTPPPGPTPTPTPTPSPSPSPRSCAGFTENFDAIVVPTIPTGWLATNASGPAPFWVTSNAGAPSPVADSLPNAGFVDDPNVVSDKRLDSPLIAITSGSAQLTFRQNRNLENNFDGGVLEISIGGAAFQDIVVAGGSFVAGGYNAMVSSGFGNPLAGRQAWSGNSNGFVTTTINLPPSAGGQNIVLRWRLGSDNAVSGQGWRIDNVAITCASPPTIFVETGTNSLAAVDSVTFVRGPFPLTNPKNFSSDPQTRILFFTTNLGLPQTSQPPTSTLSVQVNGNSHPIETVGPNTTTGGSQIVFRLPNLSPGTYPLGIRLNGVNSTNTPNLIISGPSGSPAGGPKSNKAKLAKYFLFPLIDLIL